MSLACHNFSKMNHLSLTENMKNKIKRNRKYKIKLYMKMDIYSNLLMHTWRKSMSFLIVAESIPIVRLSPLALMVDLQKFYIILFEYYVQLSKHRILFIDWQYNHYRNYWEIFKFNFEIWIIFGVSTEFIRPN